MAILRILAAYALAALVATALASLTHTHLVLAGLQAAGAPTPAFRVALVPGPETGRFELRMDPPDLGAVTLSFYRDEDGVQRAAVTAENRDTLDLLRRHADVLLRELARAGAGDVELGFEDRRDGARFFHSPNDRRAGRPAEDADAFVLDVARADLFSDFHGIDRFA